VSKPRLLDLYAGAGGAAVGYSRAGFEVIGVDHAPQPNYPFEFTERDALDVLADLIENDMWDDRFDAIHASPPCQHYADVTAWRGDQNNHPALIAPTRELLEQTGLPWVIENVRTRELRGDHMLCGTMFGLRVRRHRYFETNWPVPWGATNPCGHSPTDYSFDHGDKQPESVYRDAMGCEWMTVGESREAIPPVYTQHIGSYLMFGKLARAAFIQAENAA
jgi:hypothetical protein